MMRPGRFLAGYFDVRGIRNMQQVRAARDAARTGTL
jgi:hypothetical protein